MGSKPKLSFIRRIFLTLIVVGVLSIVFDYGFSKDFLDLESIKQALIFQAFSGFDGLEPKAKSKLYLRADPKGVVLDDIQAYKSNLLIQRKWNEDDIRPKTVHLDINASDVLVFEHIQKTGGTVFEDALAKATSIPCQCGPMYADRIMCYCRNAHGQDWSFNRHGVGWACGVHADFTELTSCLDTWYDGQENENRKRAYYFTTLIRDPVTRFISEWLHVRRGATWKECRLHCGGRDASLKEVPFCFRNGNWINVSLEEYMSCPYNMAFNRQTRMLANLTLSDCFRIDSKMTRYQRDEIMLQSAKDNLRLYFHWFGLLEYPNECQTLFERAFENLKFKYRIPVKKAPLGGSVAMLSENNWIRIVEKNSLDVRLYQFAKDLFFRRLHAATIPIKYHQSEAKFVSEDFRYAFAQI